MKNLLARLRRQSRALAKDNRGANMVEYMIVVGVIALVALAAFGTFGDQVKGKIEEEGNKVKGIKTGAYQAPVETPSIFA